MNMARTSTTAPTPAKEPGRLKQMYQVFTMTRRHDKTSIYKMALALAGPILLGVILGFVFSNGTVLGFILWIVAGLLGGVLAFLIVLGRLAEKAAFSQIEGQPGAVGAVLKSSLRRGWTASEMPVAVSPKTQDAVYRAVGNGGVVLIGEGPKSRTQRMLEEERRRVTRVLPNVPVNFMYVGPDADSTPLHKLAGRMNRFKRSLNKAEVYAVSNRLTSLTGKNLLPIPKGIDPTKARAPRPR
jgi:F0F1-type ATP synthase assembly protein I